MMKPMTRLFDDEDEKDFLYFIEKNDYNQFHLYIEKSTPKPVLTKALIRYFEVSNWIDDEVVYDFLQVGADPFAYNMRGFLRALDKQEHDVVVMCLRGAPQKTKDFVDKSVYGRLDGVIDQLSYQMGLETANRCEGGVFDVGDAMVERLLHITKGHDEKKSKQAQIHLVYFFKTLGEHDVGGGGKALLKKIWTELGAGVILPQWNTWIGEKRHGEYGYGYERGAATVLAQIIDFLSPDDFDVLTSQEHLVASAQHDQTVQSFLSQHALTRATDETLVSKKSRSKRAM